MELSIRLKTVAEAVTKGNRVADVGTDHGYVPIYLVKNNLSPAGIAMDVNKGPLEKAQEHIREEKLGGKLVLASSTYDGGLFPPMREFLEHLRTKGFRNRRVGLIEDGSWAPAAARLMRTKLEEMKDIHLYETVVPLRGALNQTSEAQMDALVAELCAE